MLRFKTDRIRNEWENKSLDRRLRVIIYYAIGVLNSNEYDKYIKITDLYRTQSEQEKIYGIGTKKKSVHQEWRGVDFIIEYESGENCDEVLHEILADQINATFEHDKENKYNTALYHDVGCGAHIHIQVSALNQTKVRI